MKPFLILDIKHQIDNLSMHDKNIISQYFNISAEKNDIPWLLAFSIASKKGSMIGAEYLPPVKSINKKKLAEGSFGEVYSICKKDNPNIDWKDLPDCWSLKLSKQSFYDDETSIREIAILMSLNHENIINIIFSGFDGDNLYYAMPLAKSDLYQIIQKGLNLEEQKNLTYQLLQGVHYLQTMDVIHRDLKSRNILVMEDNTLKIADFGASVELNCIEGFNKEYEVGTIWYRSPECLFNIPYDNGVDRWAVGCIIYEIYMGRILFPGDMEFVQMYTIARKIGHPTKDVSNGQYILTGSPKVIDVSEINNPVIEKIIQELIIYDFSKRPFLNKYLSDPYFLSSRSDGTDKNVQYDNDNNCMKNLTYRDRIAPSISFNGEITEKIYLILCDWLLSVKKTCGISDRSYFLAIHLLHSYLHIETVNIDNIKGIGVSCLLLSSMYNETFFPYHLRDISNKTYTQDQIKDMMKDILLKTKFNFVVSTPYDFLMLSKDLSASEKLKAIPLIKLMCLTEIYTQYNSQQIIHLLADDEYVKSSVDTLRSYKDLEKIQSLFTKFESFRFKK